ncbi:hypothetical protein PFISCL1PPCAC_12555, partial [Pristionchus fissidentatus]
QLRFAHMDIETSNGCVKDALILTEGETETVVRRFCDNAKDSHELVREYNSTSRFLVLTWKTDANVEKTGWVLHHRFVYEGRRCGFTTHEFEGIIASPNDEDNYEPNTNCHWEISVPVGYRMVLHFNRMDIERTDWCDNDYLQV